MLTPFISPDEFADFAAQVEGPFGFVAKMETWAIFAVHYPDTATTAAVKRVPDFFKVD